MKQTFTIALALLLSSFAHCYAQSTIREYFNKLPNELLTSEAGVTYALADRELSILTESEKKISFSMIGESGFIDLMLFPSVNNGKDLLIVKRTLARGDASINILTTKESELVDITQAVMPNITDDLLKAKMEEQYPSKVVSFENQLFTKEYLCMENAGLPIIYLLLTETDGNLSDAMELNVLGWQEGKMVEMQDPFSMLAH